MRVPPELEFTVSLALTPASLFAQGAGPLISSTKPHRSAFGQFSNHERALSKNQDHSCIFQMPHRQKIHKNWSIINAANLIETWSTEYPDVPRLWFDHLLAY